MIPLNYKHFAMHIILKLLLILSAITMTACHSEEGIDIRWSEESEKIVDGGIKTDYEHKTLYLTFATDNPTEVSVSSNDYWIKPSVYTRYDRACKIEIDIQDNHDIMPREGLFVLDIEGQTAAINVSQEGNHKVQTAKDEYYVKSDEGNVEFHVRALGNLTAEIGEADCKWARVAKIVPCGKNNEYAITISVDKNEGLGRIASVDFKLDGKYANQDCGPCVIQAPAPFAEKTTIECKKPGSLQVLMGNDIANLRRIRSLKLIGGINKYDIVALRNLFLSSDESINKYPVELDLSECTIVSWADNPYQYFGWRPSKEYEEAVYPYGIPSGMFRNAVNLKHIILPDDLKRIDYAAFSGCKNLKTIDIPYEVEEIGSRAFYQCSGLEEINLENNECLTTIGTNAFSTMSVLKEFTVPARVCRLALGALQGIKAPKLHLKWTDPESIQEISVTPKVEGCTLYVPKGMAEAYRNVRCWAKFPIVEEEN